MGHEDKRRYLGGCDVQLIYSLASDSYFFFGEQT